LKEIWYHCITQVLSPFVSWRYLKHR
jgi:hypothetical protein